MNTSMLKSIPAPLAQYVKLVVPPQREYKYGIIMRFLGFCWHVIAHVSAKNAAPAELTDEQKMQQLMGFSGFASTSVRYTSSKCDQWPTTKQPTRPKLYAHWLLNQHLHVIVGRVKKSWTITRPLLWVSRCCTSNANTDSTWIGAEVSTVLSLTVDQTFA